MRRWCAWGMPVAAKPLPDFGQELLELASAGLTDDSRQNPWAQYRNSPNCAFEAAGKAVIAIYKPRCLCLRSGRVFAWSKDALTPTTTIWKIMVPGAGFPNGCCHSELGSLSRKVGVLAFQERWVSWLFWLFIVNWVASQERWVSWLFKKGGCPGFS